jgi:hypothetical protein
MLLWPVNPEPVSRNLKLSRRIAKRQERKDPDKDAYSIGGKTLEGTDVHSLRAATQNISIIPYFGEQTKTEIHSLISQPVSKVHPLDHVRGPFMTLDEGDSLEHVLDISMAPILAFDL